MKRNTVKTSSKSALKNASTTAFGPLGRFLSRMKKEALDDRGVAMLEFVLVAPIMCYLIASTLFFQSQIDYAQDQIMKSRQKTWEKAVPDAALTATGDNSDDNKFFIIPLRTGIMAGAVTTDFTLGGILAKALYLNGTGTGTPYDKLGLKRDNYIVDYITPDAVPETGWAKMMGGFGQWFGTKIGTGDAITPDGLKTSLWKDRYPFTVNPWMRLYNDKLDISNLGFPGGAGALWDIMDAVNAFRAPLNRVDQRDDIDIGVNRPDSYQYQESGTCEQLKLVADSDVSGIVP